MAVGSENDSGARGTRRTLLILAVFLIATLLGVFVAYSFDERIPFRGALLDDTNVSDHRPPRNNSPADGRGSTVPDSPDVAQEDSADAVPSDSEVTNTVRIECKTGGGEPLPADVVLSCSIWKDQRPRVRGLEPLSVTEYVTDKDGAFEVQSQAGNRLSVKPVSEGWQAKPLSVDFRASTTVKFVLRRLGTVRVRFQYQDGQPFEGRAALVRRGADYYINWFDCDSDGTAVLKNVEIDQALQCKAVTDRVGYVGYDNDVFQKFEPHELASDRELLAIIPLSTLPVGVLRVEFETAPSSRSTYILEYTLGPVASGRLRTLDDGSWSSGGVQPDVKYRFVLLGSTAWISDWVEVRPAEVTTIIARPRQSGAIKARIVDERINPLERARLRVPDGSYFDWGKPKPRRDVEADGWSNSEGYVTLTGLPPGKFSLIADYKGKEPAVREVDVAPGGTTDIGDIVLADAIGEVTVEIEGGRPGVEYAVVVFQPSAGAVFPFQTIRDGKTVVKGLPLLEYRIAVTGRNGGSLVGEMVTLTLEQPARTVRLDVSSVEPD